MAYCEPVVEEQDPSIEDEGQQEMEKRHHSNYHYLAVRRCTHQSHCSRTQCCAKHFSSHSYGSCKSLKRPGGRCPWKKPDGYNCGCVQGYYCKRYGWNNYWGKCVKKPRTCSSDSSCRKSECCSGRRCKLRRKEGDCCPRIGADIYNCGCIEGLECREAGVGNYWGRCVKVLPPTEEPGSGVGA
ncbi:keratin-associated protein 5-2-like [Stylophora pistillata]|uniref:keratin-associated protein 5-2-like n=1 Tax=Stylophora pistillata TaxID=50429 RepID=UPI000C043AB4|nr:keratin-associated protein 5-2-like [Stylophora pistillata]